jgi:hypothetical protein
LEKKYQVYFKYESILSVITMKRIIILFLVLISKSVFPQWDEISDRKTTEIKSVEIYNSLCLNDGYCEKKYELLISLPKYTYKKFEPIMLKAEMVNHDTEALELWGNFVLPQTNVDVTIIDEKGKIFMEDKSGSEKFDIMRKIPSYVIQPEDTLFVTLRINNWGEEIRWKSDTDNDYYFASGYLEPGKYTANISTFVKENLGLDKQIKVKSNNVNFEVTKLDKSDAELLKLFKKGDKYNLKPYEEILNKYPDNPFTESVAAEYLSMKYFSKYSDKDYIYINDLERDFQNFIDKYRNSIYLLNDRWLKPYIYKHFYNVETNNLNTNLEQMYNDFIIQNENNLLKDLLKDERRVKLILNLLDY